MKYSMQKNLRILLESAGIYVLLDFPARLTEFLGVSSLTGPKNFLPLILGLLFGTYGVVGMCLGAIISAALCCSPYAEITCELLSIIIFALGGRMLWYAGTPKPLQLKCAHDYLRYLAITALLSPLAAMPVRLIMGASALLEVALSYFIYTVSVGIPAIIIISSILHIQPHAPKGKEMKPDIDCQIMPGRLNLKAKNEEIEFFCAAFGHQSKKSFDVESCLEELAIRIKAHSEDVPIEVRIYINDSISMHLDYKSKRYNPLLQTSGEASEELWGLALIRQRALRFSYQYIAGINQIQIVL